MKNKFTLKKIIVALSAISMLVTFGGFIILYTKKYLKSTNVENNFLMSVSNVTTSHNFGSYGELMFAYIGENNYIYNLDDESTPLIAQSASELLYASDDTVIYTSPCEFNFEHIGREYAIQELQIGENENILNTIANVTIPPCWSSNDEVVYFVKDENRKQLYTFEPLTSTTEMAAEFENEIIGLRISSDGLLVTSDNETEELYVPLSKHLSEAYYNSSGSRIFVCEQYDLILTPEGTLYYRWQGADEAVKIADSVYITEGYQDNQVFYIQKTAEGLSLYNYYVSEAKNVELAKLSDDMLPQLTVSADYAFVIDEDFIVYRYDINSGEIIPFTKIEENVLNPLISIFDYRLMVYDMSREADQTFVYAVDGMPELQETDVIKLNSEKEAINTNKIASEYRTLEIASMGPDVSELQNKLKSLGYYNGGITGIYDLTTSTAIQYLQNDLGLSESGIATKELQEKLFQEDISITAKKEYILSPSSTGIRVRDLQARLRTLGFIKGEINNSFDDNTENGVKLFAKQNSIDYSNSIVSYSIIDKINDASAKKYNGFLELFPNDKGEAVIALNSRLKELGYLKGAIYPMYDKKTISAVNLYEDVNLLHKTDFCTSELLIDLFSENAKTCPKELQPADLNDSQSENKTQVISDRQLKIIRKWLTKQFAVNHTDKQAVKRLQVQLFRMGYLQKNDISMIYDQKTFDAVYAFQNSNDILADGVASKSTLTEIFGKVIKGGLSDEQ